MTTTLNLDEAESIDSVVSKNNQFFSKDFSSALRVIRQKQNKTKNERINDTTVFIRSCY